MSFQPPILIGDVDREDDRARFEAGTDGFRRPVVRNPIDPAMVTRLFSAISRAPSEDWPICLEDGYLTCDRESLEPGATEFLRRHVEETGCQVVDGMTPISVDELAPGTLAVPEGEIATPVISHPWPFSAVPHWAV